jgi:amidase
MTSDSRDSSNAADDAMSRREFGLRLGAAAVGGAMMTARDGSGHPSNATPPTAAADLCFLSATELVALLRTKKVSAREVMQAHLAQIASIPR